ncbi:MAG: tRNA (N6-threonylcarbamoyladenosine(37)-N6)-methyltransferase TrmO [Syntrophorhabdus sp.]
MEKIFHVNPIGVIHSPYKTKEAAPIQGVFRPEVTGWVEIFPEYDRGLQDVEGFSHLFLIYLLDKAGPVELIRPMLLDDTPHGIFSSRHPARPNYIGINIVRLRKRNSNILEVSGLDVIDGTPLLDIKPYVSRFDSFPDASEGWFAGKEDRPKPSGRE